MSVSANGGGQEGARDRATAFSDYREVTRTGDARSNGTTDKPIIFAFHSYPWLIHRRNHGDRHGRGCKEEGTTATPYAKQTIRDQLLDHNAYIARAV